MKQNTRPHVALAVKEIERSVAFYRALFDVEPAKIKEDYAKFDLRQPALNLSLNLAREVHPPQRPAHFGIEVADSDAVRAARERIADAGVSVSKDEEGVTCCYSVQDKFWVDDPDGHSWEIFAVLENADVKVLPERSCCDVECCA